MPSYKLTYFDITGLAESLRFLLSYAGIDFEDHRFAFEDWPKYKPDMPMEQVPVLEIDGKVYHQTRAIGRYLAKKSGLYGWENDLQNLVIDAIVDDIEDARLAVSAYYRQEDEALKAKLKEQALDKIVFLLKKLQEQVQNNGGHLVDGKLSWADVHFSATLELMSNILKQNLLEGSPVLQKLYDTTRAIPKIKAYLEKRPKTLF